MPAEDEDGEDEDPCSGGARRFTDGEDSRLTGDEGREAVDEVAEYEACIELDDGEDAKRDEAAPEGMAMLVVVDVFTEAGESSDGAARSDVGVDGVGGVMVDGSIRV